MQTLIKTGFSSISRWGETGGSCKYKNVTMHVTGKALGGTVRQEMWRNKYVFTKALTNQ